MGLLARSRAAALADAMSRLPQPTGHAWTRPPEVGLVMARGRAGATGAAFNLGEVSATRCALRLECGAVGVAYVLGRDKAHAERAALVDALMQTDRAEEVRRVVLDPLAADEAARREARARKAEATRVEFFTMTRGD